MPDQNLSDRHPATQHLVEFFAFDHLPVHLQEISRPFSVLANDVCYWLPDGPELTAGLRKLLEAKDCMVRAAVAAHTEEN